MLRYLHTTAIAALTQPTDRPTNHPSTTAASSFVSLSTRSFVCPLARYSLATRCAHDAPCIVSGLSRCDRGAEDVKARVAASMKVWPYRRACMHASTDGGSTAPRDVEHAAQHSDGRARTREGDRRWKRVMLRGSSAGGTKRTSSGTSGETNPSWPRAYPSFAPPSTYDIARTPRRSVPFARLKARARGNRFVVPHGGVPKVFPSSTQQR